MTEREYINSFRAAPASSCASEWYDPRLRPNRLRRALRRLRRADYDPLGPLHFCNRPSHFVVRSEGLDYPVCTDCWMKFRVQGELVGILVGPDLRVSTILGTQRMETTW